MEALNRRNKKAEVLFQRFSAVLILGVLIIIFSIGSEHFFKLQNFLNIINQSSVLGIISIGMAFVIITAGIDLSVGTSMALSGCVIAVAVTQWGMPPTLAIILGIVVGIGVGLINSLIITVGRIQPFIGTLGIMTAAEGVALLVTDGVPISGIPAGMLILGGSVGIVPVSLLVFSGVAFIGWLMLNQMSIGRNVVAVGGNEEASRTAGIRTNLTKTFVYGFSGLCCGIAGLVMISRLDSANGLMGTGFELQAITAVALGGTSMAGGVGSISGTVIGVVTIGVLNNGLDLMNTTPFWQKVILGMMIVIVVVLDSWRKRKFND